MDNITISNQKRSKRGSLLIFILFLALVISLGGLLGWGLYKCGFGISTSRKTTKYYAVCFGEADTTTQAEQLAQELQLKGGAGFVTNDNKVLASIYTSKSEAQNVVQNNPDYVGKVVSMHILTEYKNEQKILNSLIDVTMEFIQRQDNAECMQSLTDVTKLASELEFARAGFKSFFDRMVNAVKSMNSNLCYGLNYLCVSVADFLCE